MTKDSTIISSGDDNKIMALNYKKRLCMATGQVDPKDRDPREAESSLLTGLSPPERSRAVDINSNNLHVAVAQNDGKVTIRKSPLELNEILFELSDPEMGVSALSYSPDGRKLAAGSHKGNVFVYCVDSSYSLAGVCRAHTTFICSIDWSVDSSYLRTVCDFNYLVFF